MKILIATGIYPPDIGGPATILQSLVASLQQKDIDIKVITYSDKTDIDDGVYRISKNKPTKRWSYFWQMMKLARKADLVYVTDVYSVGFFAYLIKKLTGKKYIIRFAGDAAWEKATASSWTDDYIIDFEEKVYDKKIENLKNRRRKILTNADKIIAVSNFIAKVAIKIGVDKKNIEVIYNSVDFIKDKVDQSAIENIRQQYGHNTKIISTACRLMPWKGVDGIIKILPQLKEKIGNIIFLVLGDGQELENLKKLAKELNISDNVKFLGRISHDKIINYFQASDLFILNTNYEGLSHTLLEAIKAGTPIITTDVGGNPEVIDNNKNGLLISYNNTDQLLQAAIKILSDQNLADRFIADAKIKLLEFDWKNTINNTAKLIKSFK